MTTKRFLIYKKESCDLTSFLTVRLDKADLHVKAHHHNKTHVARCFFKRRTWLIIIFKKYRSSFLKTDPKLAPDHLDGN